MNPMGSGIRFCLEWCRENGIISSRHFSTTETVVLHTSCMRWFFSFVLKKVRTGRVARHEQTVYEGCDPSLGHCCCCMEPGRELNPQVQGLCSSTGFQKCSAQLYFYLYQFPIFKVARVNILKALLINTIKHPLKHFMKRKSSRRAVSAKQWWGAGTRMGETLCTHTRPGQPLPHRHCESGIELAPEQTLSLPRSMHCNPRPMAITGHCSRDTGGPELNEDMAKTARLNVTSKHKVEKHDYYPLLGSGEAHLECCVLSGAPQGERQHTGAKCD